MRLVTWNTQWRFGKWQDRQPLLEQVLVEQAADVVLLQETWPDQAGALAEACGLQVVGFGGGYFDQRLSNVPTDEQFGNAVLARDGRLVGIEEFPSEGDPAPRCVVMAEVVGLGGEAPVLVASTHLSHLWDRPEVRSAQLHTVAARLRQQHSSFLLGADCNLVPSRQEYQTAIDLGLVDSWANLRPGVFGPTMVPTNPEITHTKWMNDRNGDAAPRDNGVRLDYLWTAGNVAAKTIERIGIIVGPRWPSDHLGLACEVGTTSQ